MRVISPDGPGSVIEQEGHFSEGGTTIKQQTYPETDLLRVENSEECNYIITLIGLGLGFLQCFSWILFGLNIFDFVLERN